MTTLQAWLVVALPGLLLSFSLFYGRSRLRTGLGYVALLATAVTMMFFDRVSGALIGVSVALLYAAGRGGQAESEAHDTSRIAVPDTVRRTARHRAE